MAKYAGKIGYAETEIRSPGVYVETIVERFHRGDVVRDLRRWGNPDSVHGDLSVTNSISIVGDAYAYEHIYEMRYIWWHGVRWKITTVDVQRPRLVLTIGELWTDVEE